MRIGSRVRDAARTLVYRPHDVLPWYLVGAGVPAVSRVISLLAFALAAGVLWTRSGLATFRERALEIGPIPVDDPAVEGAQDPFGDPGSVGQPPEQELEELLGTTPEELAAVFEPLADPLAVSIVVVGFVLTGIVSVGLNAVASAGRVGGVYGALRAADGSRAGVETFLRDWRSFLALLIVELVALAVVVLVGLGLLATALGAGGAAGVALGLLAVFGTIVGILLVQLLLAFVGPAIVVDGRGFFAGLKGGLAFLVREPLAVVAYVVLGLSVLVGLAIVGGVFSLLGAGSVVALLGLVVVTPLLETTKVSLYAAFRGEELSAPAPDLRERRPLRFRARDGFARGWRELLAFVRETPGLHATIVGVFAAGIAIGWVVIGGGLVGIVETSIDGRLVGTNPIGLFFDFAANNWTVAVLTATGGLAFAVPAAVSILFNGLAFGAIARLEVDLLELLVFVFPHGIVEIPAILIAGALGLWLGLIAFRGVVGRADRVDLADGIRRTYWVLVGIAILILAAAVIEAFVSPYLRLLV
ncbi:stage II sporulation protein M [Halalkaliarchaeum sp. AArc-GB]|uniref:stage II sporulation protein M n=1 Tax=Halalkaliarchaeum sp. AArc-GB TaxID=3074078 RepID=UPI00286426ED|nr:stage II sporulation protein M [Halalkaliarchaeum sp. AArc-GB]MDR5673340.1 stage II sporulation protein M [Halalkaliarchaeum sp. AArc-GB]